MTLKQTLKVIVSAIFHVGIFTPLAKSEDKNGNR